MMNEAIVRGRRAVAKALQAANPGYSTCSHCGWPWAVTESHTIVHADGSGGIFPTCEFCWKVLREANDRDTVVGYIIALHQSWEAEMRRPVTDPSLKKLLDGLDAVWPKLVS